MVCSSRDCPPVACLSSGPITTALLEAAKRHETVRVLIGGGPPVPPVGFLHPPLLGERRAQRAPLTMPLDPSVARHGHQPVVPVVRLVVATIQRQMRGQVAD